MLLSDLEFSDLLILQDGTGRLKGTPGYDRQLKHVPDDCAEDLRALSLKLAGSFVAKGRLNEEGSRDIPKSIRVEHGGVRYRVADLDSVESGQTWFLRRLADTVPDVRALGLPSYLLDWLSKQHQGLVLISGAQSSGKTTTASALVADWLKTRGGHGVTFECPAELPLDGPWGEFGHCFQIEILSELDLAPKIELAYRYARPNIQMIGEIKTRYAATEAQRAALGSSEQIVIATVFGLDLAASLERLANFAKELDGENALQNLASCLLAVIHQKLESENGVRRLSVPEYLLLPLEGAKGTRAKLRKGEFYSLEDDMDALRNHVRCYGVEGL